MESNSTCKETKGCLSTPHYIWEWGNRIRRIRPQLDRAYAELTSVAEDVSAHIARPLRVRAATFPAISALF